MKVTRMSSRNKKKFLPQVGFSLVEILVGLVIGLLATLVIMQVFSVFEGQKRTTTGAADAQTNGGIALYSLVRDIQMAGYGLLPVTDSAMECAAADITVTAAAAASGVSASSPLSSITIADGGTAAGATDSITVRYGTSTSAGTPAKITAITGLTASVANNLNCETGIAIILPSCDITTVTGMANITNASNVITAGTITLGDIAAAAPGNNLSCLGQWNEITYAANAGNLERQTTLEATATPSVTGIVNIQAQYGISNAPSSNQVTSWENATGAWATPTTAERNQIKAIRIAVVARNGLLEKEVVTNTCTTANGVVNNGPCAWDDNTLDDAPKIDLSDDANWQHYRYRVFETIIPLRNVIWSKGTL